MTNKKIAIGSLTILILLTATFSAKAQTPATKTEERGKELYFSWGYNTESYTNSNIKINQPGLNNNFTWVNIDGNDHQGWNTGIFNKPISIPQYNYRLGLFLDRKKGLAIEINFDHTKFLFSTQNARLKGTLNGRSVDTLISFSQDNGYFYYLNNGANFLLFNLVKRFHLYADKSQNLQLDFLAKAGVGPVIPHVQNGFFLDSTAGVITQKPNDPHFQLGGWNVGVEAAARATFLKYIYLEFSNKVDYARYSGLKIYEGTAKHAFGTYEWVLSLGLTFPVGKKVEE
jgi:opacity protein-like surface antigen